MRLYFRLFLVSILTLHSGLCRAEFNDLPPQPDDARSNAVKALESAGLFTGYADGSFRGERPVTRYELAVVVSRMMRYYEASLPKQTTLKPLTPTEKEKIRQISASAIEDLKARDIRTPQLFADDLNQPASANDVATLLTNAFARLIEKSSPGNDQAAHSANH